jgi:hypothetical protein
VAGFPADVKAAHLHSSNHRAEVSASVLCGCFYCRATFPLLRFLIGLTRMKRAWAKPPFARSAGPTASSGTGQASLLPKSSLAR